MKFLKIVIAILVAFGTTELSAETLDGKIFGVDQNNNKQALNGASIFWLGTNVGTLSKSDGEFTIEKSKDGNILIISFIGYGKDTVEVPVTQSYLEVELNSQLELDQVTVTGKQSTIIDKASIAQTEKITMHGLRKAACCNLGESFQTNAAIDVEYTDAVSGAKQIKMLGLDGIYTQIMTEKVPNLKGIGAAYGLGYIPGPWMESIQISKGAASVSTGYESVTGQINVEYKKPQNSEPLFINLFGNSMGRVEGDLNSNYVFNDALSTMILLHGNTMQSKIDGNNDQFLDIPINTQVNAMNRWNYITDAVHTQAAFKALYEDREGGQKSFYENTPTGYGLNIHTERYEAFLKSGIIIDDVDYKSLAIILSASDHKQYSKFGNNGYDGKQKSFYANLLYEFGFETGHDHNEHEHSEDCEHDHDSEEEESCEDEECEDEECGDEHSSEALELEHNIAMGLSWRYDEYNELLNYGVNAGGIEIIRNENIPGAFAEYTLSGLYDFTIVTGLRYDRHNISGDFITPRMHFKYDLNENTVFRASVGKGYHVANILSEHVGVMASSRQFMIEEDLDPEEAWNYGINMTSDFYIGDVLFTLNADYYRTDFVNQVILDLDRDPGMAYFYNLDGDSYSNSFQIDLIFEPFDGFEVNTAYRMNDVRMTYDGDLRDKPLINKHKGFLNLAYTTFEEDWTFDITFDMNGGGRLPNTSSNPTEYRLDETYDPYLLLHAQIEKKFESFSIYLGAENITDFKQPNPILAFDDPFGNYFDSSMIWGPIEGRVIYLGVRINP